MHGSVIVLLYKFDYFLREKAGLIFELLQCRLNTSIVPNDVMRRIIHICISGKWKATNLLSFFSLTLQFLQ